MSQTAQQPGPEMLKAMSACGLDWKNLDYSKFFSLVVQFIEFLKGPTPAPSPTPTPAPVTPGLVGAARAKGCDQDTCDLVTDLHDALSLQLGASQVIIARIQEEAGF